MQGSRGAEGRGRRRWGAGGMSSVVAEPWLGAWRRVGWSGLDLSSLSWGPSLLMTWDTSRFSAAAGGPTQRPNRPMTSYAAYHLLAFGMHTRSRLCSTLLMHSNFTAYIASHTITSVAIADDCGPAATAPWHGESDTWRRRRLWRRRKARGARSSQPSALRVGDLGCRGLPSGQ